MNEIVVTMSRAAYDSYMTRGKLKSKKDLIDYLNSVGHYRGTVVDVNVEANITRNPFVEVE